MAPVRRLPDHHFGGDWTDRKLSVVAAYLGAYTTALKNTAFRKVFIDGFAGTGYRAQRTTAAEADDASLFPELGEPAPQRLREGSARIALQANPPFDEFIFIERRAQRCAELDELRRGFPALADRVAIRQADANEELKEICSRDWGTRRAVLFLDPYGMHVEWATIAAVAATHAIDMWLLFPLGIGVNRLLTRSGEIPESWRRRLNLFLGTDDWYRTFYDVSQTPTLFGDDESVVRVTTEAIGKYFNARLATVFAGVAAQPVVLRNSRNNPLYLLCFAVGNPRGKEIALRIAGHLLKGVS